MLNGKKTYIFAGLAALVMAIVLFGGWFAFPKEFTDKSTEFVLLLLALAIASLRAALGREDLKKIKFSLDKVTYKQKEK